MSPEPNVYSIYVQDNCARAVKMDIEKYVRLNPCVEWFVEKKYDGERRFIWVKEGKIKAATRHNGLYEEGEATKELFAPLRELPDGLYDSEYVEGDGWHIFDVLEFKGEDVRARSYGMRKQLLEGAVKNVLLVPAKAVKTVEEIKAEFEAALKRGDEGVIVKNPWAAYKQLNAWLKLKRKAEIDVVVAGIVETEGLRKNGKVGSFYGAMVDDDGYWRMIGKIGGSREQENEEIVRRLNNGEEVVVEVTFQEVTKNFKLRHPSIVRLRDDKPASQCGFGDLRAEYERLQHLKKENGIKGMYSWGEN
jgi:ATP-dependent DNA ligase